MRAREPRPASPFNPRRPSTSTASPPRLAFVQRDRDRAKWRRRHRLRRLRPTTERHGREHCNVPSRSKKACPRAQGPRSKQVLGHALDGQKYKRGCSPPGPTTCFNASEGGLSNWRSSLTWRRGHPNIAKRIQPGRPRWRNRGAPGTKERRLGLEQYAASVGKPVTDPDLQASDAVAEMTGGPRRWFALLQPGVWNSITQAKTPEEASRVWTTLMERPANATRGPRSEFAMAQPGVQSRHGTLLVRDRRKARRRCPSEPVRDQTAPPEPPARWRKSARPSVRP